MADLGKKSTRPALAAAVSMLGLSLGVSGAEAQTQPGMPSGPAANPQGVLIGLGQPGSSQIKSEQWKADQIKSQQWKSDQWKADQIKSEQWKSSQIKSEAYKTPK